MKHYAYILLLLFTVNIATSKGFVEKYLCSQDFNGVITGNSTFHEIKKKSSIVSAGKTVFGYLPYWIYNDGSYASVLEHSSLLTHISVFSFETDSLGNLTPPPAWPWNDILAFTKVNDSASPRVIMTVTNFNESAIHKLLSDETAQLNLIKNIKDTLMFYNMNGVNIDFENEAESDRGSAINSFMLHLSNSIKETITDAEISFASPAVNWGGWDLKELAESCDYLMIMCYAYNGSWSETTGPCAPLTGSEQYSYNVQKTINNVYGDVLSTTPEKLILGVPYYGTYWKTSFAEPYCKVTPFNESDSTNNWQGTPYYREIASMYDSKEKLWDSISQTPWLVWNSGDSWNQIWYDNDSSLALKYDFALEKKLKGIGIWALGYDYGREELWNVIQRKFFVTDVEQKTQQLPEGYALYQNYPNPFNPTTTIQFSIPSPLKGEGQRMGLVTLKVYNVLGQEVATLVNEAKPAGSYSVTFNSKLLGRASIPSGIYFYQLRAGNYLESRKMILLK